MVAISFAFTVLTFCSVVDVVTATDVRIACDLVATEEVVQEAAQNMFRETRFIDTVVDLLKIAFELEKKRKVV